MALHGYNKENRRELEEEVLPLYLVQSFSFFGL